MSHKEKMRQIKIPVELAETAAELARVANRLPAKYRVFERSPRRLTQSQRSIVEWALKIGLEEVASVINARETIL